MVVDNKIANQISIGKIFSIRDAYVYLLTADTARYNPDILRRCSLNEYLTPNLTYDDKLGAAILDVEACKSADELKAIYFAYKAQFGEDERFKNACKQKKVSLTDKAA